MWARIYFLRERSFKSRQNPRVDFFAGKKRLRRLQNGVFPHTVVEFCGRWIVYNSVYSPRRGRFVNSAFPKTKNLAQNEVYLWQTNLKANACRNSTFQVNRRKNATWRRRLTSRNRIAIYSCLHPKNDTTNLFGYKLGESTEKNKAPLFSSGKETIQTFSVSIQVITLLFPKWY